MATNEELRSSNGATEIRDAIVDQTDAIRDLLEEIKGLKMTLVTIREAIDESM